MKHYLDNSATTAVSEKAAQRAYEIMTETYGNPSSLHFMGLQAERVLTAARKSVARRLGVQSDEIYFTSGGTESNNTALFGVAQAKKRAGKRVVISAVEHSSIIEAANRLEADGFEVVRVAPHGDGVVCAEDVVSVVNEETILVSIMSINNETGAVMPIDRIFAAVKAKNPNVICHTDAVQAFGKVALSPKKLKADLVSVSAHKVHAPKGCGALFVKKGVRLVPLHYGGEQEKKLRPGTEALPLIAAFAVACDEFDVDGNYKRAEELNRYARSLLSEIDGVTVNSSENALPYVLNISAGRVRSETMLHYLEELEVFVSSGSACAKGKPSYVLSAMGLSQERADSALRISFSKYNTKEDVDALCDGIKAGLLSLAHR